MTWDMISRLPVPDPERRFPASNNNSSPDKENMNNQGAYPELTKQVRQADIPVLDQPVAAAALDDDIPVLEETFAEFEKTIPVLE